MRDLREYLKALAQVPGELLETHTPVSANLEVSQVIYKLQREGRSPAVLFHAVDNGTIPVLTNLMATRRRLAIALGCEEQDLHQRYREKEKQQVKPTVVEAGPVQEVVIKGAEIDLGQFPIVTHNGQDAGPYITAGIMTVRDPDTGIRNAGIYRLMIKGKDTMAIHLAETSHAFYIYRKYCERSMDMPVAVTIGMHPAAYIGSLSFGSIDIDEYDVMGGLLGESLPIVKCLTVDLEVPAYGEICIEGFIDKAARVPEGPFGEFASLYGGPVNNPMMQVTAITRRKDPIYQDICSGAPEHQLIGALPRLGQLFGQIKSAAPGVVDVYMPPSGFGRNACYIAIKKMVEGEATNAAAAAFGADAFVRHVVVVDSDVNIFDDSDVLRAINLYMRPENCFIINRAKGSPIDPTNRGGIVSKIAIDATRELGLASRKIDYAAGLDAIHLEEFFPQCR